MIFDCGTETITEFCPFCKKLHYGIQVGEESVVCRCGSVLTMRMTTESEGEMYWVKAKLARVWVAKGINDDERNLC